MLATNTKPEVLAIIPARGGSKGIPRKNIVDLCGKPLIAYSIETALKTKSITRIIVSTDDTEIASIAEQLGAEVPFLRPESMATDHSIIGKSIQYTLKRLSTQDYTPDILLQLYPTHPFRTPKILNTIIDKLLTGYKLARTVKKIIPDFETMFTLDLENNIIPFYTDRQPNQPFFRFHGTTFARTLGPSLAPLETFLYHLTDPITHIDIDTRTDLLLAREVITHNLFDFEQQ